jgi:hypothetical protein
MRKAIVLGVCTFVSILSAHCQNDSPLHLQRTIDLPGVTGKFDHMAIDETGHRLFVAATGSNAVEVVDLASGKVQQSLTGLGKPHGLAWIPEGGVLFVADGSKAELDVFSGSPFRLVKNIKLSEDADDMVFDPATRLLYVGHGGTDSRNPGAVAVVDTRTLAIVADLAVEAHPEGLELDPVHNRIFVNISDTGQVVVIDGKTHAISRTWKLVDTTGNTPLAYDAASNRLLLGCRMPATLVVLDGDTGKERMHAPADTGVDDLFYEASSGRAYFITGKGVIDSFALSQEDTLQILPRTETAAGAKTGLLVPAKKALYVGIPGTSGSAQIRVYATSEK